jgi:hypothetical protein
MRPKRIKAKRIQTKAETKPEELEYAEEEK